MDASVAATAQPRQPPPEVQRALSSAGIGTSPSDLDRWPTDEHVERWGGAGVVVDVALDDEGRRRTRREAAGRAWAATAGVAVPEVLAVEPGGRWLAGRAGTPVTPSHEVLLSAVALCRHIDAGPPPPEEAATSWRASRATLPLRVLRLLRARVPLRRFRAARAAAAALPAEGVAHGDLHLGNLLQDAAGRLLVVDWEFLAPAPRHTDAVRLWSTLPDARDRRLVLEALLDGLDDHERRQVGVLGRWLALRALAEAADEPDPADRVADLARAREVLRESASLP